MDQGEPANAIGRRLAVRPWAAYAHAAEQLGRMSRDGELELKIRSGEHIAAITLAAQFAPELPSASDRSGGIDLGFGAPLHTVAEIKSIGTRWRRLEATMTLGGSFDLQIRSWVDFVGEVANAANVAAAQLARKIAFDTEPAPVRHVVVVAFVADVAAVEALAENPLVPELPALSCDAVDFVWAALVPGILQSWDGAERQWTTHFMGGRDDSDLVKPIDFHELERTFLEAAGIPTSESPFFDLVEFFLHGNQTAE